MLAEVKARIQSAQYTALRAVNKELVGLYWDIGRLIVERQQREGWGKGVVEQLSADLQSAFPGIGGFSASNLWRMKGFFEAYRDATKLAPLVREIGWVHAEIDNGIALFFRVRQYSCADVGWCQSPYHAFNGERPHSLLPPKTGKIVASVGFCKRLFIALFMRE